MRRAQADELERRLAGGAVVSPSAEVEEWAQLAEQLRTVAPVALVPRQAFRDELLARLMTEAAELAIAGEDQNGDRASDRKATGSSAARSGARPVLRRARRTLAGVVVAGVLGSGVAAVASTGAVPGDALYGLKRAVEDVRMELAGSDTAKASAALGQARERLAEAEELALGATGGAAGADTPELREALGDFGSSSEEGVTLLLDDYADEGDPTSLAEIDDFVRESLPLLERLRTETPASLHPVIDALIVGLQGTGADLAGAVAACGEPCTSLGLLAAVDEPSPSVPPPPPPSVPGDSSASVPAAPLPGVPTVTVPGEVVADPAAPGDGVLPGGGGVAPLPGQSSVADPLAPITDPLDPITDPLDPITDLLDPVLSPTPAPAPAPTLPCIIIIGTCPG